MHTHTFWSDGDDFPESAAKWYKDNGYDFLVFTDHNILLKTPVAGPLRGSHQLIEGELWQQIPEDHPAVIKYKDSFGEDWVDTRPYEEEGYLQVRLRPLDEFRDMFEEPGEFMFMMGNEITDQQAVHVVAIHQDEVISTTGGSEDERTDMIREIVRRVDEYRKRTGRNTYPALAHPMLSLSRGENMIRSGRIYDEDGQYEQVQTGYPYFRRMGWQTGNKPFITESGRMIVPLYSDGFSISIIAYTDDWGENWKSSTPLIGSGNIQPSIAQTPSGELVAYMRDNGPPPKRLHISRSLDNGETWSMVRDSELHNSGTLCDIVTLDSGDWVLINNDTEVSCHRLTVSLSEDGGETWPFNRSIADDQSSRSHYPAIIVGDDGLFHISYSYFREDGQKTIKYSVFNEEWLRGQ